MSYLFDRLTHDLESFHNLILKYIPKRIAAANKTYEARTMMAAIDHTHHKDRKLRQTKDGKL